MLGTPAAAAASGDRLTTEAVDFSARTLSNDLESIMADTATATELHFAAASGTNDGSKWARYIMDALVLGTHYTISVWDLAPATDRRGFGIGLIDDNKMMVVGFFNSSSAHECFTAHGLVGSPTETTNAIVNASMTGVRYSFYVGRDGDVALNGTISGLDNAGNVIEVVQFGGSTTKLALSNGFLCAFTRRGTNNGTCTLTYKAQVDSFVPANVS
tara:strand:+ start:1494 stop:2138 length:645 start_codon:yes stop_codon:yes gene_type:complete